MTQFEELLKTLVSERVEFVVIGGLAANIHGVTLPTYDIDICYNRTDENLRCLAHALQSLNPSLRGAPPNLPFVPNSATLTAGLNFTFQTDLGDLDIFGEVGGVGFYKEVKSSAKEIELLGMKVLVLDIPALVKAKKFAGRKKDEAMILELEALQEIQEQKRKNFS